MKVINIRVIPNAKKNDVSNEEDGLKVHVNAPPLNGKANKAAIELLAKHFKITKRDIRIIKGQRSRQKVVEVSS